MDRVENKSGLVPPNTMIDVFDWLLKMMLLFDDYYNYHVVFFDVFAILSLDDAVAVGDDHDSNVVMV